MIDTQLTGILNIIGGILSLGALAAAWILHSQGYRVLQGNIVLGMFIVSGMLISGIALGNGINLIVDECRKNEADIMWLTLLCLGTVVALGVWIFSLVSFITFRPDINPTDLSPESLPKKTKRDIMLLLTLSTIMFVGGALASITQGLNYEAPLSSAC